MATTILRPVLQRRLLLPQLLACKRLNPFARPLAAAGIKPLRSQCQFHTAPARREGPKASDELVPIATTDAKSIVIATATPAPALVNLPSRPSSAPSSAPVFAFVFDIDGTLLHEKEPIPSIPETLRHIRAHSIPFLLLTNGGGRTELKRATDVSEFLALDPPIPKEDIIQCHTPFKQIASTMKLPESYDPYVPGGRDLKDAVMVVGGAENRVCRDLAEEYGFKKVVLPMDIFAHFARNKDKRGKDSSSVWPYRLVSSSQKKYAKHWDGGPVDAIFVFDDPRDWGMNIQIILDFILPATPPSDPTTSPLDTPPTPPALIFSNPDLIWSSAHPTPRLGQGSFRAALEGTYRRVVEGTRPGLDPQMKYHCIGKPFQDTYKYAQDQFLEQLRKQGKGTESLKRVYMFGDNPLSDIKGANLFDKTKSGGIEWISVLVETGVYKPGQPLAGPLKPKFLAQDVTMGVEWALQQEGWI